MDKKRLKKIRKYEAFQLPQNYFENFERKMMEQLPENSRSSRSNWLDQLVYRLHLRIAIPALALASLVAAIIYIDINHSSEPLFLNDQEISEYLLQEYDAELEKDIYAMSELVYKEELDPQINMSDQEILEYLAEDEVEDEVLEMLQ